MLCALAMMTSPARAQSEEMWEGTWRTNWGEWRLIQNGSLVYGDYGSDRTVVGVISPDQREFRGRYEYADGRVGYFEVRINAPDNFMGKFRWRGESLPHFSSEQGGDWNGTRINGSTPNLRVYKGPKTLGLVVAAERPEIRTWWLFQDHPMNKAAKGQAQHEFAQKVPAFADFGPGYDPGEMRLLLTAIGLGDDEGGQWQLYGQMKGYAKCDTADMSIRPLSRTLYEQARERAAKSRPYNPGLYIENPSRCLRSGGRVKIHIQTNMFERDARPILDDAFGNRAFAFYLDQLPRRPGQVLRLKGGEIELTRTNMRNRWLFTLRARRVSGDARSELLTIGGELLFANSQ